MYTTLLLLFSLLFAFVTWRKFEHGIFFLFLLLPTYLIRFSLFGIPSTLLEVMIWILFLIFVLKEIKNYKLEIRNCIHNNKLLTFGTALFLLGATISLFTSVDLRAAAGEWKAFYIEPFLLFTVLLLFFWTQQEKNSNKIQQYIIIPLLICGLATSMFAIYQHFTGWMVPEAFWANGNSYRVTAWYGFPNGVGLFLAPLVPLALSLFANNFKKKNRAAAIALLFLLTAPLAILFAKSTGGLVGVAAGVGLLLLLWKKTRWPAVAIGVIGIILVLFLPQANPIKTELLAQDRSGQIRRAIWSETTELLRDRPLLGAGLASYTERIEPYHTRVNGEGIEIFHHPHNIFLTMWVNTGLIGLIGFILMIVWFFVHTWKQTNVFLLASMVALLTTGLVDSPYIKNDLSVFFWVLFLIVFVHGQNKKNAIQ